MSTPATKRKKVEVPVISPDHSVVESTNIKRRKVDVTVVSPEPIVVKPTTISPHSQHLVTGTYGIPPLLSPIIYSNHNGYDRMCHRSNRT